MSGDMGEIFEGMKELSKKKRERNRDQSPTLLVEAGIIFETKNAGAHLIVEGRAETIDFWPGTGKWISRSGDYGRGVFKLINRIKKGSAH